MVKFLVSNFWGKSFFLEFRGDESVDEILDCLEHASKGAKYILPIGFIPPEFEEKLRIIKRANFGNYLGLLVDEILEDVALDRALQSGQSVIRR